MSVDLAVWEGPQPASDDEARATFDELYQRFISAPPTPPSQTIAEYVSMLLARYPDLADSDDETHVEVPWGSGPLLGNASGPIVYIDMKLNTVFQEGWRHCVEVASQRGLVAFDPQSGTLADPDPNFTRAPSAPDEGRRGSGRLAALYRWVSLRSYRWPFLRPLVPLLRRFR